MRTTGALKLGRSQIVGRLILQAMEISRVLSIPEAALSDVLLDGTHVEGQMSLGSSTFTGKLQMEHLTIGGDCFLRDLIGPSDSRIDLAYAGVNGNLDFRGATLPTVVLKGARIAGELRFGSAPEHSSSWRPGATLDLRNATTGSLQDTPQAWPDLLELDGFEYHKLGGLIDGHGDNMAGRDSAWWKQWLERQPTFSPQPYRHLSEVLTESGHAGTATDILYYARERERATSNRWPSRFALTALKWTIGYGYHLEWSLVWVTAFVFLGAAIFRRTAEARASHMPWGLAYSFDMLLPIVKLREIHYAIDLHGKARYYFYIHKLFGYVLAACVIAGISELLKP